MIQHNGADEGFYTENRIYPDDHAAIVVTINGDFGSAHYAIADAIQDLLLADSGVARARQLYTLARDGHLNSAMLTANANFYPTPAKLAEYRASFLSLGEPKAVTQTQSGLRGGFISERFLFDFGTRKLMITLRAEPGVNGLVEEFLASPIS